MDIFDYENQIKIKTTKEGKVIIETTPAILTVILNSVYDCARYQQEHGWNATAKDRGHLFNVLYNKKARMKGAK